MSTILIVDPVRIETGSADCEGRLVYRDGRLIGVLTQLDPLLHEDLGVGRHWYLEAVFGRAAAAPQPRPFPSLDEALTWLERRSSGPARPATLPVTPHCAVAAHLPSAGWCGTGLAPPR
ncbi:hypothetical protein ACQVP2_08755 [Methylobacterium aquaticum]|uniref:hypothetical protein n=1 Tax=Methylobacterium aquaticum TaxID=270351 RepID=UPI003D1839B5